jgi:hypothetical protein
MMTIDIKVTAELNQEVAIPKRNTGLILLGLLEYPVRKYNNIGLVQLFCRVAPIGVSIILIVEFDFPYDCIWISQLLMAQPVVKKER